MIFDTHCHGYWKGLAHRQTEVRGNMLEAGVMRTVQIGTDYETSRQALALAREWTEGAWSTAGIHPTGCQDLRADSAEESVGELERLVRDNADTIVAIGETGLDYYHLVRGREREQKSSQHSFFRAHAALALRLDLPLVIHTRNAAADTAALIKETGIKRFVIHCFSEHQDFAEELLAWSDDGYFSFSGILTYDKAVPVKNAARTLPLERILVETDAPFLVPKVLCGTSDINEPAFVKQVMDCLKTTRDEPADMVEQAVWENSNRLFRLDG